MNVAHTASRKHDDIEKALLLMLEYNDKIDMQCRALRELLQIIEWYYLDQSRDLSQVSASAMTEYHQDIVNYDIQLDSLNNKIALIVKNIIDHFDFENEDMQCLIDTTRAHI